MCGVLVSGLVFIFVLVFVYRACGHSVGRAWLGVVLLQPWTSFRLAVVRSCRLVFSVWVIRVG